MNQHDGVVNRLLWAQDYFKLDAAVDVILQKTTFCFDVSVWELFWPLIAGIKLVFAKPEGHKDNVYLRSLINQAGITTIHFVPSMLSTFLFDCPAQSCQSLKRVLCSGEALKLEHIYAFQEKLGHVELFNLYGPTEAAIDVTAWKVPKDRHSIQAVTIGKPVANTPIFILDQSGNLAPIGVPGELIIGGVQVAKGYLNRPQLTMEKFVKNPFSEDKDSRLYRTGDLAKWLPDGNIVCLGRIDNQVKIRGFRIELGEIETILLAHASVKACVVIAKEDGNGFKNLVAYIVSTATDASDFDKESLRQYLLSQLPEYMVPSLMKQLAALPLTANGKVDKKALPEVDSSVLLSTKYVSPQTATELHLVEIWKPLLELSQIGIHDNFFELGGHSLLATRVVAAIRKTLQVEVTLKAIFDNPTIAGLSNYIEETGSASTLPAIEIYERPAKIPLSYAQERLWFIDQLQGSVNYHMPIVLEIKGKIEEEQLTAAFRAILNRHEVLRTVYLEEEGKAYQLIRAAEDWEMGIKKGELKEDYLKQLIARPFDLSKDYMLRADLLKEDSGKGVLVVVLHHIASDGWSMSILVKELMAIYQSLSLIHI